MLVCKMSREYMVILKLSLNGNEIIISQNIRFYKIHSISIRILDYYEIYYERI